MSIVSKALEMLLEDLNLLNALQDIVECIEKAYHLFSKSLKGNRKMSLPSFKKVKKYSSITLKQAEWKLFDTNKIRIGKIIFKIGFEGGRALAPGLGDVRRSLMSAIAGKNLGISNSLDWRIFQLNQLITGY